MFNKYISHQLQVGFNKKFQKLLFLNPGTKILNVFQNFNLKIIFLNLFTSISCKHLIGLSWNVFTKCLYPSVLNVTSGHNVVLITNIELLASLLGNCHVWLDRVYNLIQCVQFLLYNCCVNILMCGFVNAGLKVGDISAQAACFSYWEIIRHGNVKQWQTI